MTRRDPEPATDDQPQHPTWLTEGCPPWCTGEHGQLDHPDDRYHRSEASIVPGVVAARPVAPVTASLQGLDLVAWLGRYVGESVEWVVIEPIDRREPRLVVTAETARSLVQHLTAQLTRLQPR
ncbi:hypothetical protein P5P86_04220 [Nocardioides sp. BP30]|uniref:DUF6907 domain-containing protein n=1 Tax=Nocardioides sp. BP30 TaxID=3036374 RepID=UPI0024687F01|nr:hypothetical protein [Nocardioides sp. BP30]WGL53033.1 hypothetical protein P5P86_04220 [Nocardioides sp. BP30]